MKSRKINYFIIIGAIIMLFWQDIFSTLITNIEESIENTNNNKLYYSYEKEFKETLQILADYEDEMDMLMFLENENNNNKNNLYKILLDKEYNKIVEELGEILLNMQEVLAVKNNPKYSILKNYYDELCAIIKLVEELGLNNENSDIIDERINRNRTNRMLILYSKDL